MNKTWIWSDTHLNHANIIKYANRPFTTVEEMNEAIIDAWKSTIAKNDIILHLGDVGFGSMEYFKKLIPTLPGKKLLVLGNHDRKHSAKMWKEIGFSEVYPFPIIYRPYVILSHENVFLNEQMPYLNIHGHIHQHKLENPCYINVSVEQIGYKPVLLDSLINRTIK